MQEGIQYLNYASKSNLFLKVEKFIPLLRLIPSANKKRSFGKIFYLELWTKSLDRNQIDERKIGGKHSKHTIRMKGMKNV